MHITILGKLESKYLADFEDKDNLIISMNQHWDEDMLPRVDKWFDLHEIPVRENCDYTKENFPFEECHELVHGKRFCTTAAYLIAWAVLQGADKISLYGMKFTPDHERRIRELHNVREMIYFCWGRGIEVEVCPEDIEYLIPEHIPLDGADFDQ